MHYDRLACAIRAWEIEGGGVTAPRAMVVRAPLTRTVLVGVSMNVQRMSMGLIVSLQCSLGCGVSPEARDVGSQNEDLVRAALGRLGFQPDVEVTIDDEQKLVGVSHDLVFDETALLNGDYARGPEPDSEGLVQKGYLTNGMLVSKDNAAKMKLRLNGVDSDLQNAARNAATVWSNSGSAVLIDPNGGEGLLLRVTGVDPSRWPMGGCMPSAIGCASPPHDGGPGEVWIPLSIQAITGCEWSPSLRRSVLLHEMGHAIGFAHPEDWMTSMHITGTLDAPSFPNSYYPSVMHAAQDIAGGFDPNFCDHPVVDWLEADDINSLKAVYPR